MVALDKNTKIWLIAGLAALLLIICCGCGVFGYLVVLKDDAEDVAEQYLSAIQDKNEADVRELLCVSKRDDLDDDEFDDSKESLLDWEITSSKERENSATVTVEITATGSGKSMTRDFTMTLVSEDGDWKVCDLEVTRG